MAFKVLLVNSINPTVETETRQPHLGLAYIAAAAREGLPALELDFRCISEDIEAHFQEFQPDLVGITTVSQNYNIACEYTDYFIRQHAPVVWGGIHISIMPETLPKGVTAACLGEGEETFKELIHSIFNGSFDKVRNNISGLAFWDGGQLIKTTPRAPIKDIDSIPFPERDLLEIKSHTYMFTSRGCPYRCQFCASSRYWDKLRFFSAEYVVDEIQLLHENYGVDFISFYDDLFAANVDRVERMVELLEERGLSGKIRYSANCRANIVTERLAKLLKRMNVVSIGIGCESGDSEMLHYLKGKSVTVEDNYRAVSMMKKQGIFVNASFVIGSPGETLESIKATERFIKTSGIDLIDIYILTPYPGTPVWDYACARGFVHPHMEDWTTLDVNAYRHPETAIVLCEKLSRKELLTAYKRFQRIRLWHNVSRAWRHPMRHMIPRVVAKMIIDKFTRLFQRKKHNSTD